MNRAIALLITVAILQTACSKSPPESISKAPPEPICRELDTTIDNSIKQVALTLAESDVVDRGAMQQAARYIAANNHLQVIQISLNLQSQHKCPIRKSVINPLIYRIEALKCFTAMIGEKKDELPILCDIKNWKGN